jgi:hypothetical protein
MQRHGQSHVPLFLPSPGTPGEGWGGGLQYFFNPPAITWVTRVIAMLRADFPIDAVASDKIVQTEFSSDSPRLCASA